MGATHAWFSAETALRHGSSVYRKADGSSVNVTRLNADLDAKGSFRQDEKYVGQVLSTAAGGCVRANTRVDGISR